MKIAVVILNFNGVGLLRQFLPDVVKYSPKDIAKIYVVDNNSSDNSVSYIKQNYSSVKIIQNDTNGGYSRGYNLGLKSIKEDIYCLLNSDIQVTENWLDPIAKIFKTQLQTSIVQPKILSYNNKEYFEYAGAAGGFIDALGYPYCRGRIFDNIEKDQGQYDDEIEIFWASGACFFIKKDVFWHLGALDEKYFSHQEEIDLCWRAFNMGYKTKYTPSSVVYHVGGATLSHAHWRKTFFNFRNSLFNLVKNKSGCYGHIVLLRLLLDGVAGVKFLISGQYKHTLAIAKAHLSFYKNFKYIVKKRRENLKKLEKYYFLTSIVWCFFILRKKDFFD